MTMRVFHDGPLVVGQAALGTNEQTR